MADVLQWLPRGDGFERAERQGHKRHASRTGPGPDRGAGPAGLAAAVGLADRGLAPLVLDRRPDASSHPQATGLTAHTTRHSRRARIRYRSELAGLQPAGDGMLATAASPDGHAGRSGPGTFWVPTAPTAPSAGPAASPPPDPATSATGSASCSTHPCASTSAARRSWCTCRPLAEKLLQAELAHT
jgi:FAD binding domain